MGGSSTGRHADGPELYGPEAVWPADWRARWQRVRAEAVRRFVAPRRMASHGARGRALPQVLRDAGLASTLRLLARRHGADEADVARLWSACDGGDPRRTSRRVAERLRLIRGVESALGEAARTERLRVRAATRDHVRTLAVTAALELDGETRAQAVRRFLKRALPEELG
jgi:hypothetical protein